MKTIIFHKTFFAFTLLCLAAFTVDLNAQDTYTSNVNNADWDDPSTWTCAGPCAGVGYPNLNTDIVIIDGHSIDVDGSTHHVGSVTLNPGSNSTTDLFIINGGNLTIENNFVATKTTSAISELNVNNSSLLIKGSADFDNLGTNNRLQFQITNGGQVTINSDLTFEYDPSSGTDGTREILVQGANGGTVSTLNVGGNVELIRGDDGNSDAFDIKIENGAIWNVTGNLTAIINDDNDCSNDIDIVASSSDSEINIGGNLLMTNNGGRYLRFDVQSNSQATIQGNVSLTHNKSGTCDPSQPGGNRAVIFQAGGGSAVADINGDILFCAGRGGDALVSLVNGSDLKLAGKFIRSDNAGSSCPGSDSYGELFMSNVSTLTLDGTTEQNLPPSDNTFDVFKYEHVIINNTGVNCPNYAVICSGPGPSIIDNSLTLTDGIVQSTVANTLTLGDNVNSNLGSDDSFVDGPVRKLGNDGSNTVNLPTGDIVSTNCHCGPIGIFNPQNSGDYTAEYFHSAAQDPLDKGVGVDNVSSVEHWGLSQQGGNDVEVTLYWKDAAESGIDNLTDLIVVSYDASTTWQSLGQGSVTGGVGANVAGSVTSAIDATDYIEFTFGNVMAPLPVELISFSGSLDNNSILLNWKTATETNNRMFSVEKLNDANQFETIGNVAGNGNSVLVNEYDFIDRNPISGNNYYRLKQIDFDGKYEFSNTININNINPIIELIAYPNPSIKDVRVVVNNPSKEKMLISLTNNLGLTIWKSDLIISNSNWIKDFQLDQNGIYTVSVQIGKRFIHQKIVVVNEY